MGLYNKHYKHFLDRLEAHSELRIAVGYGRVYQRQPSGRLDRIPGRLDASSGSFLRIWADRSLDQGRRWLPPSPAT
jgi:hypothetical protein